MQVVSLLNQKGGVGKTTIALNLAAVLHEDHSVLLVDADHQGSIQSWVNRADEAPDVLTASKPNVHEKLPLIAEEYDYAVIDTPAGAGDFPRSAARASDLVLMPIRPSAFDVWSGQQAIDVVRDLDLATTPSLYFVVSQQIVGTNLADNIDETIDQLGIPALDARTSMRVGYQKAQGHGYSVLDIRAPKAEEEMRAVATEVRSLLD